MTLIVALQGSDGLVLAADSRGTIGDPRGLTAINDSQKKLLRLSRYCGIGISGASELAAKLIDEIGQLLQAEGLEYVDPILDKTRDVMRQRYDNWFAKFKLEERPFVGMTLVGYNGTSEANLVPRTYLLVSATDFAPQLFPAGCCLLGIPQYAVYLMHRLYNPDMTVEHLARLAAYLVSETATQDPKVGGPIHIATIQKGQGFKELETEEVARIQRQNDKQSEKLKKFFFRGPTDAKKH